MAKFKLDVIWEYHLCVPRFNIQFLVSIFEIIQVSRLFITIILIRFFVNSVTIEPHQMVELCFWPVFRLCCIHLVNRVLTEPSIFVVDSLLLNYGLVFDDALIILGQYRVLIFGFLFCFKLEICLILNIVHKISRICDWDVQYAFFEYVSNAASDIIVMSESFLNLIRHDDFGILFVHIQWIVIILSSLDISE